MAAPMLPQWNPGTTDMARTRRRKHRWVWWALGIAAVVLAVAGVFIDIAAHRAEPFLRALIVQRLQERFHARVELGSFQVSLSRGIWAEGKGLRIWPPAQVAGIAAGTANKPLIEIADFRFHAPLHYESGKPIHIRRVELRGLVIDVPPKPHFVRALEAEPPGSAGGSSGSAAPGAALLHFQVDAVVCTDAHLTLETSNSSR